MKTLSLLSSMSANEQNHTSAVSPTFHEQTSVDPVLMERLSTRISEVLGLHYPPSRWTDLRRGLRAALSESGHRTELEFIERLARGTWTAHDADNLALHLTIGETYFWREPQTLAALQNHVLPALLEQKRHTSKRLRLWSAGCCTGEEPYSLAILLHHMMPDINDWDVQILATDLNPRFLEKARKACYRAWSFRGTPLWVKERYFQTGDGETFRLVPEIARMVTFKQLNLATDNYPSLDTKTEGLDIVFCRNVLIYMDAAQTQAILGRFTSALNDNGWLALSPTETWLVQSSQLTSTTFGRAILFQKKANFAQKLITAKTEQNSPARRNEYSRSATREIKRPAVKGPVVKRSETSPSLVTPQKSVRSLSTNKPIEKSKEVTAAGEELIRARASANRGLNEEALHWCNKALERDKLSASTYYLRASILQETGDIAGAMQSLSHAIFLEPGFVMAHFSAGNLALQAGKTASAARHFNNAARLLERSAPEEIVPESDELTAAHLLEIIRATLRAL